MLKEPEWSAKRPAHDERPARDQIVDECCVFVPAGLVFGRPASPRRPGAPPDEEPDDSRARHASWNAKRPTHIPPPQRTKLAGRRPSRKTRHGLSSRLR